MAAAFFTTIGLPLARAVAPAGMPALAMAPALGWAVFTTLALPLLTAAGFGWLPITAYALAALAAAAMVRRPRAAPFLPGWSVGLAALMAALPILAIMPKAAPGGLLLAPPIFDHVKIAVVDAILRTGLPVPNPFYGPGGPGQLAYYYLWHFGTAVLASGLHIGGWAAEAAMTGCTAFASLLLIMGLVVAVGGRAAGLAASALLALAGTARPVVSALTGAAWADAALPRNADLAGWLNQSAWVPQHLASACCLILAALLLARLAAGGGWCAGGPRGGVAGGGG